MHIYQQERYFQDESQAFPKVDKNIAMSSGQLCQVRNSFNATLDMIYYTLNVRSRGKQLVLFSRES